MELAELLPEPENIHVPKKDGARPPTKVDDGQPPDVRGYEVWTRHVDDYWLKVPLPDRPKSDFVWHYTDSAGAAGVVSSGQLWATAITALNDAEEFNYGARLLQEQMILVDEHDGVAGEVKEFLRKVVGIAVGAERRASLYTLCASEEEDSLSQWRGYSGDSTSYAFGLGTRGGRVAAVVVDSEPPRPSTGLLHLREWRSVVYDRAAQVNLLRKGLGYCAAYSKIPLSLPAHVQEWDVAAVLITLIMHCKDPAFKDEREVRIITEAPDSAVQFRPSRFGVTPYVRLAYPEANGMQPIWTLQKHDLLPIGQIRVGPTAHPEPAITGMRTHLRVKGYRELPVSASAIPFR